MGWDVASCLCSRAAKHQGTTKAGQAKHPLPPPAAPGRDYLDIPPSMVLRWPTTFGAEATLLLARCFLLDVAKAAAAIPFAGGQLSFPWPTGQEPASRHGWPIRGLFPTLVPALRSCDQGSAAPSFAISHPKMPVLTQSLKMAISARAP